MITAVLSRPTLSTKAETHSLCSRMVTIFVTMAKSALDFARMGIAVIVRVLRGGGGGDTTFLFSVCFAFHKDQRNFNKHTFVSFELCFHNRISGRFVPYILAFAHTCI